MEQKRIKYQLWNVNSMRLFFGQWGVQLDHIKLKASYATLIV